MTVTSYALYYLSFIVMQLRKGREQGRSRVTPSLRDIAHFTGALSIDLLIYCSE
jgi:hypothetical protein